MVNQELTIYGMILQALWRSYWTLPLIADLHSKVNIVMFNSYVSLPESSLNSGLP